MARNRWVSFVTKLNDLTQSERIRWRPAPPDVLHDLKSSDVQFYTTPYVSSLDNGDVRIYKEKAKRMTWDEVKYWDEDVVLDLKTDDGVEFVRVPRTPGLEDLYSSVVYKANKVNEFLDDFLKKD